MKSSRPSARQAGNTVDSADGIRGHYCWPPYIQTRVNTVIWTEGIAVSTRRTSTEWLSALLTVIICRQFNRHQLERVSFQLTPFACTAKPDAFPSLMGGQCVNTRLCTAIFEESLPLMGWAAVKTEAWLEGSPCADFGQGWGGSGCIHASPIQLWKQLLILTLCNTLYAIEQSITDINSIFKISCIYYKKQT